MYLLTNGSLILKVLVDPFSCENSVQWPFSRALWLSWCNVSVTVNTVKVVMVDGGGGVGGGCPIHLVSLFRFPMPATFHLSLSNENIPEQANSIFSSLSLPLSENSAANQPRYIAFGIQCYLLCLLSTGHITEPSLTSSSSSSSLKGTAFTVQPVFSSFPICFACF